MSMTSSWLILSRPRSALRAAGILLSGLVLTSLAGCLGYAPPQSLRPPTEHLEIRHEVHGTSHATRIDEGVWYVLQGNRLVMLDPRTGREINVVELSQSGRSGPAVDLLVNSTTIYVVLEDALVVELDRTDPVRPWIEHTYTAEDLGVLPRAIGPGRAGPIVSGVGGAVQLPSMHRLIDHEGDITSVVEIDDQMIYTKGRRAYRAGDDGYVGSASTLAALPPPAAGQVDPRGVALPGNAVFFIRNETSGGLGGLAHMDKGMLLEVDARHSTEAMSGTVNRLRLDGDRVLIVSSRSVHLYRLGTDGRLSERWSANLSGIRDADFASDTDLLVVGDFGQARLRTDRHVDPLVWRNDAPGGLMQAISNGREIIATGVDHHWKYQIGHEAKTTPPGDQRLYPQVPRRASQLGWEIELALDGQSATIQNDLGRVSLAPPLGSSFTTVVSADGSFWLAHGTGIIMLKPPKQMPVVPVGWEAMTLEEKAQSGLSPLDGVQKLTVTVDGPVIFLQPLDLGSGVAYAAGQGGFGVVREIF